MELYRGQCIRLIFLVTQIKPRDDYHDAKRDRDGENLTFLSITGAKGLWGNGVVVVVLRGTRCWWFFCVTSLCTSVVIS